MIRSILLPIADLPLATSARDTAFWLARKDGCRIHALALIDVKAFEIPIMGTPDGFMPSVVTPPIQESQTLLDDMTAMAKERLEQFVRECGAQGIPCSTDIKTGIPGEIIARQAVAHDIVVLSRSGYSHGAQAEGRVDPLVPHAIRGSIRPVLVSGQRFNGEVRNVLVAFDGSVHAARALTVAAELGARPGVQCTVATIASSEELGSELLAPAEAYLYHHGLTPKKQVVIGNKPSELICGLVESARADILVMGAYGHSPIREMLFGSTTERVLSHCGCTVILQS